MELPFEASAVSKEFRLPCLRTNQEDVQLMDSDFSTSEPKKHAGDF